MSNRTNGSIVREFEEAFARYVGARYAIACCNGTATLHTALVALGVQPGDRVAVPPLTMASTTLAVLHAGAVPEFVDVDPQTWVVPFKYMHGIAVSLYGLWSGQSCAQCIEDAAQTLNRHRGAAFTSYSFQASKILSAGEGGMLVTDDPDLALRARAFSRLGYVQSLGDVTGFGVEELKHPMAIRHGSIGYNYRMADCQAALLLPQLECADAILAGRRYSADCCRQAIADCDWITPQYVPEAWPHSWWTYAVALRDKQLWEPLVAALERAGGERPYAAWRLSYQEPGLRHLAPDGTCPVAEDLQPRLLQLATNHDRPGAERAAECLQKAIASCGF